MVIVKSSGTDEAILYFRSKGSKNLAPLVGVEWTLSFCLRMFGRPWQIGLQLHFNDWNVQKMRATGPLLSWGGLS